MAKLTQADIDKAYAEGKKAYFKYIGTHGPTLKQLSRIIPANPYPNNSKLAIAWERGYYQDCRRIIA